MIENQSGGINAGTPTAEEPPASASGAVESNQNELKRGHAA